MTKRKHPSPHVLQKRLCTILDTKSSNPSIPPGEIPLSQDDVVYFQKQAIYRLLHLQYVKNSILNDSLQNAYHSLNNLILANSTLFHWWNQFINVFEKNIDESNTNNTTNNNILVSVNVDDKSLNNQLSTLYDKLSNLLNSVLNDKNVKLDDLLTNNNSNIISKDIEISNLNNKITLLTNDNQSLKEKIEDNVQKYDRINSKSLKLIKKGEVASDDDDDNDQKVENKDSNTNNTEIKKENSVEAPSTKVKTDQQQQQQNESSINDIDTQLKISSIEGINESLKLQLDEKINFISNLENKINELEFKLKNFNDDDELIKISSKFKSLIEENKKLNEEIEINNLNKEKVQNQLFEIESKLSLNENKTKDNYKSEISNNNNYITKIENDLNRIRSDRDSLLTKINVYKLEKGKNEFINLLLNNNETLTNRINELEKNLSLELEKISINEQNEVLVKELKEIENAFKLTRENLNNKIKKNSEYEIMINKLSVEKTKADEKYFQAMRLKDSLSSQNKILSLNLAKQNELIEMMKSNEIELEKKLKVSNEINEILERIEKTYITKFNSLTSKIDKQDKLINEKINIEKDLNSTISQMKFQIQQLEKKYSTIHQQYSSEKKQVEHLKNKLKNQGINSNNNDSSDDIQEALLSMTKCSLCRKNFKNVSLKTCGHCFCKECVDDRLNSRMRKCPICNSQFSRYDILNIHL